MQINLLSFNQSELCVELKPRPSSDQSSNELEPLKLLVTWSEDDRFRLQVATPELISRRIVFDSISCLIDSSCLYMLTVLTMLTLAAIMFTVFRVSV